MDLLEKKEKENRKGNSVLRKCPEYTLLAPAVGFEPTTLRLTAACSTVELRRNVRLLAKCGRLYHKKLDCSTLRRLNNSSWNM